MMNKKKIAVDVDGVIFDLIPRFAEIYNDKFGTSVKKSDWYRWDYHSDLGMSDNDAYKLYRRLQDEISLLPLIDNEIHTYLRKLNDLVAVDIVTARLESSRSSLLKAFNSIGIMQNSHYDRMIFVPTHPLDSKSKLDYDFYLDDNPNLADTIRNNRHKILLLFDQPWNRSVECNEKIYRIKQWKDILSLIKNLK